MSKITFRADDDLVAQLEALETSKSEAMREALRSYLEADSTAERGRTETIDELVRDRVDERLRELGFRIDCTRSRAREGALDPQDVTVTVGLGGTPAQSDEHRRRTRESAPDNGEMRATEDRAEDRSGGERDENRQCTQCGDSLDGDHVYCPNCGEKASRRLFCDCGDEIRSDWSFCPSCGRRTPAADVLESDSTQY